MQARNSVCAYRLRGCVRWSSAEHKATHMRKKVNPYRAALPVTSHRTRKQKLPVVESMIIARRTELVPDDFGRRGSFAAFGDISNYSGSHFGDTVMVRGPTQKLCRDVVYSSSPSSSSSSPSSFSSSSSSSSSSSFSSSSLSELLSPLWSVFPSPSHVLRRMLCPLLAILQ